MLRNDLIIAINNIFDENVNLKVRNEYLERYYEENEKPKTCCAEKMAEVKPIDLKIIEYGKKQLCEKVIRSWDRGVSVSRNRETNEIETTPYDAWLERKIYDDEIPDDMSKNDVKNIIYNIAIKIYEEEKINAIKKFEDQELEEKKGSEENE